MYTTCSVMSHSSFIYTLVFYIWTLVCGCNPFGLLSWYLACLNVSLVVCIVMVFLHIIVSCTVLSHHLWNGASQCLSWEYPFGLPSTKGKLIKFQMYCSPSYLHKLIILATFFNSGNGLFCSSRKIISPI